MILQYDVENNLSIRDRQRVVMMPSGKKEKIDSILEIDKYEALPVIAIYGKNASGKTNTIKSLEQIFKMVSISHNFDPVRPIDDYNPFIFINEEQKEKPTTYEIVFVVENKKYVYGFSYNSERILEEYLYVYNSKKASKIFDRNSEEEEEYSFGTNYVTLSDYIGKTHKNKLFLSIVAQWAADQKEINSIYDFFRNGMVSYPKDYRDSSINFGIETTMLLEKNPEAKDFLGKFIKYMELEMKDFKVTNLPVDLKDMPEQVKAFLEKIATVKNEEIKATNVKTIYEINDSIYELDLGTESNGIQKLYQIFPLIFYALTKKRIILIDEIETGLHPTLIKKIIQLFQNKEFNKFGSQLIFTTHLTSILDSTLLRRDQIWFTERNLENNYSTEIFPLSEIKGVRISDNLERDYLKGEYVNVPTLNATEEVNG